MTVPSGDWSPVAQVIARGLAEPGTPLTATPLSGGVSSDIYAVQGGSFNAVVKRALPRLRVAQDWLADPGRVAKEARALTVAAEVVPEAVPRVLDLDLDAFCLVLERAPEDRRDWRSVLLTGEVDPRVAARLGTLLGAWHRNADLDLDAFSETASFVELRIDPFHLRIRDVHPDLAEQIDDVVTALLEVRTCLVHGDFSPKNVLVGADADVWVLDWEVAHRGNPVFDVAFLVAHLLLKAVHRPADAELYRAAAGVFLDAYGDAPAALDANVGCLVLARVDGKSPVPYLSPEQQDVARAVGRDLLTEARPLLDDRSWRA